MPVAQVHLFASWRCTYDIMHYIRDLGGLNSTGFGLYIQSLEMKAWCHMLVCMVSYHRKHNCVFCWKGKVVVIKGK
jgi:hypothetical protein